MSDFEPPSFSLGFDFDLDSPPPPPSSTNPTAADDFDIPATSRTLKRLRRRPGPEMRCENGDDEIEEFSSQEDPCTGANMPPSSRPSSGCSTSKFSLHGHRVLTTQSTGKCKMARKEQVTDTPASTSTKGNSNGFTFPKLTVSPLRKFQLLDSDSESDTDSDSDSDFDDPCANEYANVEVNKVNSSSKAKLRNPVENPTMSGQKRANVSGCVSRGQDLGDDLYMEKRFTIPTPALDEVCEEYFQSVKNNRTDPPCKSVGNCSREIKGCVQTRIVIDDDGFHCKLGNPVPPAHHYFHHDDPRVRNLVRSRLPYFSPLGATHGRNQHTVPSAIDYMSQFNHGPSSKPQAAQKTNPGTSSKRVKKHLRKSNIEEVPEGSGSWVNPRSSISIPTDAGKRRVQAVGGQSAGHWFTSPEGKRVYVSKTGQELTGRAAYTHYRKESGKGFKRSGGKKKGAGKKKSVGKKKAAANKR